MKRQHRMPFGSEAKVGGVRFRLWAPGASRVALCLEGLALGDLPMTATGNGWFERFEERARPGSRYRFSIDGGVRVPDPASRFNPEDVHQPSEVVDPNAFNWHDAAWRGRPWHEAAIYELHVGTFSPEGTFAGVIHHLDYLAGLGVSALELMPVADFPGRRNWGYDGVLPFAPDSRYGRPEDLKALVEAAHTRGLMVLLDVVYNHFGPEGNYLGAYAPTFFTDRHRTPWGAAIDFDGPASRTVRNFFVHNALYWLEEFHFDGLRVDAVHAIFDDSEPDIVVEIARAVRRGPGGERHIHLVLENDHNAARYLRPEAESGSESGSASASPSLPQPRLEPEPKPAWPGSGVGPRRAAALYNAQWNDDLHHALHVLLTGETDGYYADYAGDPAAGPAAASPAPALRHLGRCLAEGFAWQGEPSPFRGGAARGEPSRDLPPTAFVAFLQNHDQIGNRAFGERLSALTEAPALAAATALLLLAPSPPLLFMGEEFLAAQPFLFFCDFGAELAPAVARGRREEFARSTGFGTDSARGEIPDPCAGETFRRSRLDWDCLDREPHRSALQRTRELLALRRREIVPRLAGMRAGGACEFFGDDALAVRWTLGDDARLAVVANFGAEAKAVRRPTGSLLHSTPERAALDLAGGVMPPWSVVWLLDTP